MSAFADMPGLGIHEFAANDRVPIAKLMDGKAKPCHDERVNESFAGKHPPSGFI
jgi:hypothetical protein